MNSHLSAISRKRISSPARYLAEAGLLKGTILDYGCGKGKDAEVLELDRYDPHYFPKKPHKFYKVITCTYVLNVVSIYAQKDILRKIKALLKPSGKAYITVRRDIRDDSVTHHGYPQRRVRLKLPIIKENSSFCIYELK